MRALKESSSLKYRFLRILKHVLKTPCLIIILGFWRSGKTDTALLIGELSLKYGLVDKVGSNIFTFGDPRIDYIISIPHLKRWLHKDRSTKLYLFDEALKHVPSRGAMSKKNIMFVKLLAEVSKGHGRIIIISQTEEIDKILKKSEFLRLTIQKLSKKTLALKFTNYYKVHTFGDIPRTTIKFDKDLMAEFSEKESVIYSDLSQEMKCASLYADNVSLSKISKDLRIFPQQVKRNIQKVLKAYLERGEIDILKGESDKDKGSPESVPSH